MNLPIPPLPASTLNSNITFGELQKYTFEELSNWVDELRNELLKVWDDGLPPHIGMDKQTPLHSFTKGYRPEGRFTPATGKILMCGAYLETDDKTGFSRKIEPFQIY